MATVRGLRIASMGLGMTFLWRCDDPAEKWWRGCCFWRTLAWRPSRAAYNAGAARHHNSATNTEGKMIVRIAVCSALLFIWAASAAWSQTYPTKPIRLVV